MNNKTKQRAFRILFHNKLTRVALIMIVAVILVGVLAPIISSHDPNEIHTVDRYSPPCKAYLLGTDGLGRDVYSRIIYGTRVSLSVGLLSVAIGLVAGVTVGTVAAYKGGIVDSIVVEFANMLVSLPTLLLGILILSLWGPGFFKLVITLALAYFPRFIRLSRGLTLSFREKEFVEAARAIGRSDFAIVFKHILPNTISGNIVAGTLWVAAAILAQAGLSFLGLGIQPPTPTWGAMIKDGVRLLLIAPWISIYPGIAIAVTVIGFNMLGDGIRDLLDPKVKGN